MAGKLIDSLYVSGFGSAAASGTVQFFGVGTISQVTVFSDDALTQPITQPITLDSTGRTPLPVYTATPVRAIVRSSAGTVLQDIERIDGSRAELVAISNANTTAGDLNSYINAVAASTGGTDAKYVEGGAGSVARTIQAKFSESQISVTDYGAVGNGVADCTGAFNAAINRLAQLGGGILYIPPGTFNVSTGITAGNLVQIIGSGPGSTVIRCTSSNFSLLSVGNQSIVRGIQLTNSNGLGGGNVALTASQGTSIYNVNISNHVSDVSASSSTVSVYDSSLGQATNITAGVGNIVLTNCTFGAGAFSATTLFAPRTTSSSLFLYSTTTADMANGGTTTPAVNVTGQPISYQRIRGTTAGGGTVNATATGADTKVLILDLFNNSGGAYLFTLNAQYKNAGNPNPANGSRVCVAFVWNPNELAWVEIGRATST